jgi:hypothetical protein
MIKKMSKNRFRFRRSVLTIGVAALLLVLMVGVLSADPDEWDLDEEKEDVGLIMWYEPSHDEEGSVTIATGEENSKIWVANEPCKADGDCSFCCEGDWFGHLRVGSTFDKSYTAAIGYYCPPNENGNPTFWWSETTGGQFALVGPDSYFSIDENCLTVPKGCYLALRITNTDDEDEEFTITTEHGCSVLTYPCDAEYPFPELATLALTSTGLIALLGYVAYRRRK